MIQNRFRAPSWALLALLGACGGGDVEEGQLRGTVGVDGSSTVFPITEAVAEDFRAEAPAVRVTVGISGTGGGFKKFANAEIDIADASRPIDPTEVAAAQANGIEFIELPIAYDGLSVVVHPSNDWVDHLTVEELQRIWQPESTVRTWRDVRPQWPDREIALYGPGTDSGTFDYFTEAIMGRSGASRSDYTASEDDNVLVQGVGGDPSALGFFGFAYYVENAERLKIVPIDPGTGPVAPSQATINDGSYRPLSRPVLIYVARPSADRPEVAAFVDFYLDQVATLAEEVGYVALPEEAYAAVEQHWRRRVTGSVYSGGHTTGTSIVELLGQASTAPSVE
ncbi:MAG TPA: PstS family phosphate ABC transporter substrate-binding protein [Thermoanaerobaculia bacterium]|nr:PstS family phosphate ABC transporter substrate-binding protein [Thermoanaerobaculia bacterium]